MLVANGQKREPMGPDLLRQRRNLLITSLILISINLAGATLKNDVSVLGAGIVFENPERIVWGVWVLWAYFLVRYSQYLTEEPDFGIEKGMTRWIFSRFSWNEYDTDFTHHIFWHGFFWSLCENHKDWDPEQWVTADIEPKNKLLKSVWTVRAFLSVATKTPRFTDYVAPLFVALLPALLCVWSLVQKIATP